MTSGELLAVFLVGLLVLLTFVAVIRVSVAVDHVRTMLRAFAHREVVQRELAERIAEQLDHVHAEHLPHVDLEAIEATELEPPGVGRAQDSRPTAG